MPKTNITYKEDKGLLCEFFCVMNMLTKHTTIDDAYGDHNGDLMQEEAQAYIRIFNTLSDIEVNTGFRLFFSEGTRDRGFLFKIFREKMEQYDSLEMLIDDFQKMSYDDIIANLIMHYDNRGKIPFRFYQRLCENNQLLSDYINGMEICPQIHMELVNYILAPDHIKQNVINIMNAIMKTIRDEYRIYRPRIVSHIDDLKTKISENGDAFLIDNLRYYSTLLKYRHIEKVYVTYLNAIPYSSQIILDDSSLYVYLGRDFDKKPSLISSLDLSDISAKYRPFSDDIRIQVLKKLQTGYFTLSELSSELCMPATSLLHHLNIMENAGVITREGTGKKGAYALKRQGFVTAIYTLKLFMDCCESN